MRPDSRIRTNNNQASLACALPRLQPVTCARMFKRSSDSSCSPDCVRTAPGDHHPHVRWARTYERVRVTPTLAGPWMDVYKSLFVVELIDMYLFEYRCSHCCRVLLIYSIAFPTFVFTFWSVTGAHTRQRSRPHTTEYASPRSQAPQKTHKIPFY